jgi:hypothetical protein
MPEPLHPAPVSTYQTDHREAANRAQLQEPTELLSIWRRTVESLARDLCMDPIEAHGLLRDAAAEATIGLAWEWWPHAS